MTEFNLLPKTKHSETGQARKSLSVLKANISYRLIVIVLSNSPAAVAIILLLASAEIT